MWSTATQCSSCGVRAGAASRFRAGRCGQCQQAAATRTEARTAAFHVVVLGLAVVAQFVTPAGDWWALLLVLAERLAVWDLLALVVVVMHEGAHALVALAVGGRVERITIGLGPAVAAFGSQPRFVLRVAPLAGVVHWVADDAHSVTRRRWEHVLVSLSGPLAHVPAAMVAFLVLPTTPLADAAGQPSPLPTATFTAGAILVWGALNLVPIAPRDGQHLWQVLTTDLDEIVSVEAAHDAALELQAVERGERVANRGDRDAFLAHLASPGVSPRDRALSLNNLATADLLLDDPALRPEALASARQAVGLLPDHPVVRNTYGLALLAVGDVEEGVPLVTETLATLDPGDRRTSHVALALAHARTGNVFRARPHVAVVHELGWTGTAVDEALDLLGPLEARVVRAHRSGSPEETAADLRAALGPVATTTGWILDRHVRRTGTDVDLATIATALAGSPTRHATAPATRPPTPAPTTATPTTRGPAGVPPAPRLRPPA